MGRLIAGGAKTPAAAASGLAPDLSLGETGMEVIDVRGIDVAFECLEPVAVVEEHLWLVAHLRWRSVALKRRQGRRHGARPHVDPDHPVDFVSGVGLYLHLAFEVALGWFR